MTPTFICFLMEKNEEMADDITVFPTPVSVPVTKITFITVLPMQEEGINRSKALRK
jgi:hypothetical protein